MTAPKTPGPNRLGDAVIAILIASRGTLTERSATTTNARADRAWGSKGSVYAPAAHPTEGGECPTISMT